MSQVALFLISLFSITWGLGSLLKLDPSGGLGSFLATLLPSVWMPTIVALILTGWAGGAVGIREELRARLRYRAGSAPWLIVAGFVPVFATVIAILSARAAGDVAPFVAPNGIVMMVVVQVITGATGEELGWRGFLLPRLGKQFGEMRAAWVMGMFWALWHVPAFYTPGMPHEFMPMASTLLLIVLFGVFLAFVFNRAGQSVLATMLAHLSLNIMLGVGGVNLSSTVFWRTMAGIYGALAVVAMITSKTPSVTVADERMVVSKAG